MLLGYPVLGIWYWCSDQTIVQRVLGARSEWDAQVGPIFAGFIKVLPVFLMVFPGVIAYVLFRDKIGEDADATLSVLILELLPRGMQGLVLAGLLAAMMSTVAGALNSTATLVSIDIVKRMRPDHRRSDAGSHRPVDGGGRDAHRRCLVDARRAVRRDFCGHQPDDRRPGSTDQHCLYLGDLLATRHRRRRLDDIAWSDSPWVPSSL